MWLPQNSVKSLLYGGIETRFVDYVVIFSKPNRARRQCYLLAGNFKSNELVKKWHLLLLASTS